MAEWERFAAFSDLLHPEQGAVGPEEGFPLDETEKECGALHQVSDDTCVMIQECVPIKGN